MKTINTKNFLFMFLFKKNCILLRSEKIKIMNQTYNAINLQHAIQPISSKWGEQGRAVLGDLEKWSRNPMFEKYPFKIKIL